MADGWSVPFPDRARHQATFQTIDVGHTGFITGLQARNVLSASGLPQQSLAHIWNLADIDKDGRLSLEEFTLSCFLIEMARAGRPLPPALTPDLVPPSYRKPTPGSSRTGSISEGPLTDQIGGIPPRPVPPVAGTPTSDWAVPPQTRMMYLQMFQQYDTARVGFISGMQARPILSASGLPQDILAKIWALSDVTQSGKLNPEEFVLALYLIEQAKTGRPLPPTLPPSLLPPSRKGSVASIASRGSISEGPLTEQLGRVPPVVPPAPTVIPAAVPPQPAVPPSPVVPPSPTVVSDGWAIPQPSRNMYQQLFLQYDTGRSGFISGVQARGILVQSGLPNDALAKIWNLSDINVDGRLTCEEFILAMFLIEQTKAGRPLPTALPPELVPPSYRKGTPGVSRTGSISEGPLTESQAANLPPPAGVMMTEWAIPQPSKLKYVQVFNTHDRSRSGFLSGVQARGILVQSGLSQDILAKIWALCDVTLSGRLTCEEFVLAMHLIDMVRAGEPIPIQLPPELVPPSHRRKKSASISSVGSSGAAPTPGIAGDLEPQSPGKITSFEDKRKENYDRGQAVLDRKRQVLMDQQRREQEERERKEREEQAKREKVRLEMERKRQEEIERQLQKQREIEEEKEEARRKELERREAARREMERQRMIEWESQRIQELTIQKQRATEAIQALKHKKTSLVIQVEKVNKEFEQGEEALNTSRTKVKDGKGVIDNMRIERDGLMKQMTQTNAEIRTLNEKEAYIKREKERIHRELKAELASQGAEAANVEGEEAAKIALQAKQARISQLREQINELEQEKEQKTKDSQQMKNSLDEILASLDEIKKRVRNLQNNYQDVIVRAKRAKEIILEKQANFDPNANWGAEPEPETPVEVTAESIVSSVTTTALQKVEAAEKAEYHVVYPFEARNADELTLNPGETVWVIPDPTAEEGWLKGEINGAVGWFPEAYAEPVTAATQPATITNEVPAATEIPAAADTTTTAVTDTLGPTVGPDSYIAIYPWTGMDSGNLSIKKNDIIHVTEKQDEWMFGELNGKSGWFPASYVNSVAEGTQPVLEEYYLTMYPFDGQESGDLSFSEGELVLVTKKDGEWWTGRTSDDRVGVFPSNYVREADTSEIPKPPRLQEPLTPSPAKSKLERKGSSASEKTHSRKGSVSSSKGTPSKKGKGKKPEVVMVVAAYKATGAEQLNLEKGQLIAVRKKNPSGWWEGETQQKGKKKEVGWFPATYVKPLAGGPVAGSGGSSARSTPDVKSSSGVTPEGPSERVITIYPFKAQHDDELTFEANEVITILSKDDPTWWKGQMASTGAIGLFPSNHVTDYKSPFDQQENSNMSISSSVSSSASNSLTRSTSSPFSTSDPVETKRQARINELIATEEAYVRDLEIVSIIFRDQLFSTRAITAKERDILFGNWNELLDVNKKAVKMLHRLKRESHHNDSIFIERIGETLSKILLLIEPPYTYYCSRLLTAERLMEKKADESGYFSDQVKRFSKDPRLSGLTLAAYLLIPLQRVTRYPLLIRKILESTEQGHPDFEDVQKALSLSEGLCSRVNESRRAYENRERLQWMESHISFPEDVYIDLSSPSKIGVPREVLNMGSLTKVKSGKELMAFLCTDFLLLTLPSKEIGKVSNLFASEKALNAHYNLYKKPLTLDLIEVYTARTSSNSNNPSGTHSTDDMNSNDSNRHSVISLDNSSPDTDHCMFEIIIRPNITSSSSSVLPGESTSLGGPSSLSLTTPRVLSLRAISANDRLHWIQKLNKAISFFKDQSLSVKSYSSISKKIPMSSEVKAKLLTTVSHVTNVPFKHSTVCTFFIVSIGNPSIDVFHHSQVEESSVGIRVTPARRSSIATSDTTSVLVSSSLVQWEHAMRFLLTERDLSPQQQKFLNIYIIERTPYSPDTVIGTCSVPLHQVKRDLRKVTSRPLVISVPLVIPSQHDESQHSLSPQRRKSHQPSPSVSSKVTSQDKDNKMTVVVKLDIM